MGSPFFTQELRSQWGCYRIPISGRRKGLPRPSPGQNWGHFPNVQLFFRFLGGGRLKPIFVVFFVLFRPGGPNLSVLAILFCATPLWRDGLQKQVFSAMPPLLGLSLDCDRGHFFGKKWGCSSDNLRYHRKHSSTGVLLHLSRDEGGYFGRVTKARNLFCSRPMGLQLKEILPKTFPKKNFGQPPPSQVFFFPASLREVPWM